MSIHLFITPYPPEQWETASSDLQIDSNTFALAFQQEWPLADVKVYEEGGVSWNIPEESSVGFYGSLQTNLQIIGFVPGTWTAMFDLILWYRRFVDISYQLYFFNSSSWDSIELTNETTKQDIQKFLGFS